MASQVSKPPSKPVQARRLHRKFCAGKQTKGQKSACYFIIGTYVWVVKDDFLRFPVGAQSRSLRMASQSSKPPSKPVQARRLHRKFCSGKQTKGQCLCMSFHYRHICLSCQGWVFEKFLQSFTEGTYFSVIVQIQKWRMNKWRDREWTH